MKKLLLASALLMAGVHVASAQNLKKAEEGTSYYLPRTEMRFTVQVEKTSYTPGEFAVYAEKYMKLQNVKMQPAVSYRIINIKVNTVGERDTAKYYMAPTDGKHNIQKLQLDDNGVLLAINATPKEVSRPKPFVPAAKPKALNPHDYMNEDILSAGSSAKMAELSAVEIYDIRDSKSALSKGQADFMPKDGEQLKLMLGNLDTQERALMQLFSGVTTKDTTETVISFVPVKEVNKQLLFRFSKWMGMTDADDLGGSPYYVSVADKHLTPSIQDYMLTTKKPKDNSGIYVNLPGKIAVTLFAGNKQQATYELYAAQFGKTEQWNDELGGRKFETQLVLNPVTGSAELLKADIIKK